MSVSIKYRRVAYKIKVLNADSRAVERKHIKHKFTFFRKRYLLSVYQMIFFFCGNCILVIRFAKNG